MSSTRLLDQRDMLHADTVEEVRARWALWCARAGIELVSDGRTVAAYVNHGRWVADCPTCNGGIACWFENPSGCCLDCGHVYTVAFPVKGAQTTRAINLLLERPRPNIRNWDPDAETAGDLLRENKLRMGESH